MGIWQQVRNKDNLLFSKRYSLSQLKEMCIQKNLSIYGTKLELAKRINYNGLKN